MKLGVICDGISRNLEHALTVMTEFGLEYAELQYVWDQEIGDHSSSDNARIKELLQRHSKQVSCLSRHLFAGLTIANKPSDQAHSLHMEKLKRVIEIAHELGSPFVRVMTPKKEAILWGSNGAEVWNVAIGAWDRLLELMAPAVDLARVEGMLLAVETGNGIMVNSNFTARKLIDDLDAKDCLKVLWDPANCCWCHEIAYPTAYEVVQEGYLGHVHIKDVKVDTPRAHLEVKEYGNGQLAPFFPQIACALKNNKFGGCVSFESVYHPDTGDFEAGFRSCIHGFMRDFH